MSYDFISLSFVSFQLRTIHKKNIPLLDPTLFFYPSLILNTRQTNILFSNQQKMVYTILLPPFGPTFFCFFIYHSSSPNSAANSSANPDRSTSWTFGDSSTSSAAATSSTTAFFGSTRHRIVELTKLYSYA